jgi:glutamate--cysteine ligase
MRSPPSARKHSQPAELRQWQPSEQRGTCILSQVNGEQLLARDDLIQSFRPDPGRKELVGVEIENGLALAVLDILVREWDAKPMLDGAYVTGVELPAGGSFTLETGGALEYASAPSASLADVVRTCREDLTRVAAVAERLDIAILSGGCLPFTPVDAIPWNPKPRVSIMRDYFKRLGPAGMYAGPVMGLVLSTQTSLDYTSLADLMAKLHLHVLASPVVAALFVNSPMAECKEAGALSRRMQYWRRFDPRRCGVLEFAAHPNATVGDLVDWAMSLPMIYRKQGSSHVIAPDGSFADLMRNGFGDGTWPTLADWELHLCQTWPHVRVRRQLLELRASDGLPWPHFAASPAFWAGLTYDPQVRTEASALLAELSPQQLNQTIDDVAEKGLAASAGPYSVQELNRELLRLARRGLTAKIAEGSEPAEVLTYLEPLEAVCDSGETFAERCLTAWTGELRESPEAYIRRYRIPACP